MFSSPPRRSLAITLRHLVITARPQCHTIGRIRALDITVRGRRRGAITRARATARGSSGNMAGTTMVMGVTKGVIEAVITTAGGIAIRTGDCTSVRQQGRVLQARCSPRAWGATPGQPMDGAPPMPC